MPAGDNDLGRAMSGKWFTNRGQVVQILIGFAALVVGIVVAFPQLPVQQGFQGFVAVWPIIIFPLVALVLMWLNNKRMHRTIETLVQKAPTVSVPASAAPEPVKPKVPFADLFPKLSGLSEDGWRIVEVYVVDIKIKVGSYWDEPATKSKMRISAIALHEEPGRRSAELSVRTSGSIIFGSKESDQIATNRYKVTISRSGHDAEERSIYQFSFSDDHIHFFVVRVDGLDTASNEVALQVAKIRVFRTAQN
jgi:hypothetical protein